MNPPTAITKPADKRMLWAAIALFLGWICVLAGLVLTSSENPRDAAATQAP